MLLRLSALFVRTLRDDPVDAELPSHKLLVRAGYVRRSGPGIYSWLPLGLMAVRNVERVVREEMASIGAQEVVLPALVPKEVFEVSGRWDDYGDSLFRLEDRRGAGYLLAPTHEELFTLLVKSELSSYRDFPLSLFQVQTKYRDEARVRPGSRGPTSRADMRSMWSGAGTSLPTVRSVPSRSVTVTPARAAAWPWRSPGASNSVTCSSSAANMPKPSVYERPVLTASF